MSTASDTLRRVRFPRDGDRSNAERARVLADLPQGGIATKVDLQAIAARLRDIELRLDIEIEAVRGCL